MDKVTKKRDEGYNNSQFSKLSNSVESKIRDNKV